MNDNDPHNQQNGQPEEPFVSADDLSGNSRRDPSFSDYDDDFEESERDTDYASAYEEESSGTTSPEQGDETGEARSFSASSDNPWSTDASTRADNAPMNEDAERRDEEPGYDRADLEEDWDDEEDYPEEADEPEPQQSQAGSNWPVGLVVVGLVALALLAAGGYGVIQQRAATQEEIRELQAALATAASPADVLATRGDLREMEKQAENNLATIEVLTLYNKRLTDTVAGLEKQLAAQQAEAPSVKEQPKAATIKPPVTPAAKTVEAKPAATKTTAAIDKGDWFVNFSSYSLRSAAENWVEKLSPSAGKAVVAPTQKNGKTLYRVRIVGLADRAQAEKVAGQLQTAHGLPSLWVGRE